MALALDDVNGAHSHVSLLTENVIQSKRMKLISRCLSDLNRRSIYMCVCVDIVTPIIK